MTAAVIIAIVIAALLLVSVVALAASNARRADRRADEASLGERLLGEERSAPVVDEDGSAEPRPRTGRFDRDRRPVGDQVLEHAGAVRPVDPKFRRVTDA